MTPDEARHRILLALKRHDDTRAAEAKKRDGRKVIPMDEWREKLDEIEEAKAKATPGTWREHYDYRDGRPTSEMIGAVAPGHRILTDHEGGTYPNRDLAYIVLAANNADRLARFVQTLSWVLETSLKRDGSSEVEIAQLLDDWWKESAK